MLTTKLLGKEPVDALLDSMQTPGFLLPTFAEIGAQLNTDLAIYPPPPPESTYRRTQTLGRTWTHEETVSLMSIQTALGNVTPYARYVQDPDDQAAIHQNRWQTTKSVLENREQWIVSQVLEGIRLHAAKFR